LRGDPAIVVFEDVHWADEATLDVLRLLGRRIATVPALLVASYRDDELDRAHPLRVTLGELSRRDVTDRLRLVPLSVAAVAELAAPHGIDAAALHRRTAGNPFFVTEALAGDAVQQLEECLSCGVLGPAGTGVAFRHELARVAVEETLAPNARFALHRRTLAALAGHADPAPTPTPADPKLGVQTIGSDGSVLLSLPGYSKDITGVASIATREAVAVPGQIGRSRTLAIASQSFQGRRGERIRLRFRLSATAHGALQRAGLLAVRLSMAVLDKSGNTERHASCFWLAADAQHAATAKPIRC
jgi:hypothetical protein